MSTAGGAITLFSTDVSTDTLDLPSLFGVATPDVGRIVVTATDPQGQGFTPSPPTLQGDTLVMALRHLNSYKLVAIPRTVEPSGPGEGTDNVYFPDRAQSRRRFPALLADACWSAHLWLPCDQASCGAWLDRTIFREQSLRASPGEPAPYNVLLGRLGADTVVQQVFPAVQPFQEGQGHAYFPQTGHSLRFAFLGYWTRNGGLAQFGYPISEEIRETSPTDGNEYHPEYKGTNAEVLLGLLDTASLQSKG